VKTSRSIVSQSPEETLSLGESWGKVAEPGWVVGLSGDLGAGKTQFVRGFARGLGITHKVQSPTFALINEYSDGRFPLAHIDLYRLDSLAEIVGAGLEESFFRPAGITIVEWIERWFAGRMPSELYPIGSGVRFRLVQFEQVGETSRRITYEDFGA
jgi:tRNA threonylcarbamoyladenosine biosynthesis protein TsaE